MSNVNRQVVIGGDASGAVDAFESMKETGKEMFENFSKAAQNYTDNLSKQAEKVAYLIDKEKELAREKMQAAKEEAAAERDKRLQQIKTGATDASDPDGFKRKKQALDDYNQAVKRATRENNDYNRSIDEANRLNRRGQEDRKSAGGGMFSGAGGAMAGGIAGFLSGSGVGALASAVVGGGLGMLNSGLGMIGGGVTGALFTQGERLSESRRQLMALTGRTTEAYTYRKKVGRAQLNFEDAMEQQGEGATLERDEEGNITAIKKIPYDKGKKDEFGINMKAINDLNQHIKTRHLQGEAEFKAEKKRVDERIKKDETLSAGKRYDDVYKTMHGVRSVAVVGTPAASDLGIDAASVANRQRQLAMGAGTRQAAMAGEVRQLLRLERGMGIGEGALQGLSDIRGLGGQTGVGDMMTQFLTLATKSKLWDVDKRDFSAIPREIKTLTAFMQTQSQSMVRPDAAQAMALRAQFAQLDEDKTTGLFAGARGQNLMMGINQAIQSPANAFQSAMTLEAIMRANPDIGGGSVGLMKARAIQARGLFHGGGSTFQAMLDQMKEQTNDPEQRRVLLTTRFKSLLPYVMDKEGAAAMDKMFETDFATGDMAENLKAIGFTPDMLTDFKIGTGTSEVKALNTRIIDKLGWVGTSVANGFAKNINEMIDFMAGDGMMNTIAQGINMAGDTSGANSPNSKKDRE